MSTTVVTTSNDVKRIIAEVDEIISPTTLTAADSGKTYFLKASTGKDVTLPAAQAGLNFRFIVRQTFDTSDFSIISAEADKMYGVLVTGGSSVAVNAADRIDFELGAETQGDYIYCFNDGTNWWVEGMGVQASSITGQG
jgi:hypothetical protein